MKISVIFVTVLSVVASGETADRQGSIQDFLVKASWPLKTEEASRIASLMTETIRSEYTVGPKAPLSTGKDFDEKKLSDMAFRNLKALQPLLNSCIGSPAYDNIQGSLAYLTAGLSEISLGKVNLDKNAGAEVKLSYTSDNLKKASMAYEMMAAVEAHEKMQDSKFGVAVSPYMALMPSLVGAMVYGGSATAAAVLSPAIAVAGLVTVVFVVPVSRYADNAAAANKSKLAASISFANGWSASLAKNIEVCSQFAASLNKAKIETETKGH